MAKNKVYLLTYLLFGVFSFINCQTLELIGHYAENESYDSNHNLFLKKDGSFQYIVKEGLSCDTILGNWYVVKNKHVILTPKKTEAYHVEIRCDTCVNTFYIRTYALQDGYVLSKPNIKVFTKGSIVKDEITNSLKFAIMQNADSIQVNYFGFEPYVFIPQNKNNVIANIFLEEEQQKMLQKDIILKIKKSKLVTESGIILRK
jgi:hypothetical protein